VSKFLIAILCVFVLVGIFLLIGWKLGLVTTFYTYKIKR
jgi:hypothetical protein